MMEDLGGHTSRGHAGGLDGARDFDREDGGFNNTAAAGRGRDRDTVGASAPVATAV